MKIMSKYVARSLVKNLFTILSAVTVIYVAVDFFEKIDDFLEAKLPLTLAAKFFLLQTPFVLAQVLPVAVLLAALVVLGLMAKHNEVIAFAAGGGGGLSLLKPVAAVGVCAGLFLFLFNEAIVPATAAQANRIWHQQVRGEGGAAARTKDIWFKKPGMLGRIGRYDPDHHTATDVTLNYFDPDFRLVKRLDAQDAVISGQTWTLRHVMESHGDRASGAGLHETRVVSLDFSDEDLHARVKSSMEMSFLTLSENIKKIEKEGYKATRFRVDLAAKIAFPMVCVIMAVLGGAMALRGKRGEGLAVNVVLGMGLAFAYWVIHSLCMALGYAGMYPPAMAAWTANVIFALLAVAMAHELA